MLTGKLVEPDSEFSPPSPVIGLANLTSRVSEPVIQSAMRHAMQILGREFVLGTTIENALARSDAGELYSYDMLGEAAREQTTAQRYLDAYLHAIETIGLANKKSNASISIKLSALHPRFEPLQRQRVLTELVATVLTP